MNCAPVFALATATRKHGFALLELVIVLAILALVAAIAVPNLNSSNERRLTLAAEQLALAMRFARLQTLLTETSHGISFDPAQKRMRVFRLDPATTPASIVYDVYHPLDKQLFDVAFEQQSVGAVAAITANAQFRGVCAGSVTAMHFDRYGTAWCTDPDNVLMQHFELTLVNGTAQRRVTLDGINGRVQVR